MVPLRGKLWHAFRAKRATERKHLSERDVVAAGGWKNTATFTLYQRPDEATMLQGVLGGGELRGAKRTVRRCSG